MGLASAILSKYAKSAEQAKLQADTMIKVLETEKLKDYALQKALKQVFPERYKKEDKKKETPAEKIRREYREASSGLKETARTYSPDMMERVREGGEHIKEMLGSRRQQPGAREVLGRVGTRSTTDVVTEALGRRRPDTKQETRPEPPAPDYDEPAAMSTTPIRYPPPGYSTAPQQQGPAPGPSMPSVPGGIWSEASKRYVKYPRGKYTKHPKPYGN